MKYVEGERNPATGEVQWYEPVPSSPLIPRPGNTGSSTPPQERPSPVGVIHTVFLCDGSSDPEHFEGTREELKAHQRDCPISEVGDLYRMWTEVAEVWQRREGLR